MGIKTLEQKPAKDLAGLQIDLLHRLRNGNLSFEQIEWFKNLPFEQREKLMGKQPEMMFCLKLLSGAETLMLDTLDGKETLASTKKVFPSGIDDDFIKWGTNKPGVATKEQAVEVYELVKDATFAQIFGSLGTDLNKLCLTQAQIKNFCKKHSSWLRKYGHETFFLFKDEDQFFVVDVSVDPVGLHAYLEHCKMDFIWSAKVGHRIVIPQQN